MGVRHGCGCAAQLPTLPTPRGGPLLNGFMFWYCLLSGPSFIQLYTEGLTRVLAGDHGKQHPSSEGDWCMRRSSYHAVYCIDPSSLK